MEVILVKGPGHENEFTEGFRSATTQKLVDAYNSQVGNRGWVSAKGRYLYALYHELKFRKIDISVIDTGTGMRLDQRVVLDTSGNRVILAGVRGV